MKLVQTIKELQSELDALRSEGKTIGLVPTMGALHAGHASLVKRAVAENDVVVVSDFVNPTQFNDKNDLAKYPRTLDADCELLEKVGAAFVFAPSVEEIYPEPDTRQFSYAPLDTVMEGRFRPGHFNGVCQIVSKLFMIVNPTRAYFGEKDFQQLAIIREMVKQIGFNGLEIVGCPIVREEDGLLRELHFLHHIRLIQHLWRRQVRIVQYLCTVFRLLRKKKLQKKFLNLHSQLYLMKQRTECIPSKL